MEKYLIGCVIIRRKLTGDELDVYFSYVMHAEYVQTAICLERFVCGLTVPHALRVVRVQQVNVVA